MGGHSELARQLLVAVLRQHQAGGEQDRLRIGAGRAQHADGAVRPAMGDDEPVIVGEDDATARRARAAARLRRTIASVGSVRNAVAMSSPAATSTISSHRGRPPVGSAGTDRGRRWPLAGAGAEAAALSGAGADGSMPWPLLAR